MNHGGTPQASSEPIIDPADVPTMTSAVAGAHPVASARAASPPASHAPPRTPPAPSTSPTRGRSPVVTTRTTPSLPCAGGNCGQTLFSRGQRATGRRSGAGGHAIGVVDALDAADEAQQVTEMLYVAHLEGEAGDGHAVAAGRDRRRQDVHVRVGQDAG